MPKFDLGCKKCGRMEEIVKNASSDPNPPCSFCESTKTMVVEKFKKHKPFKIQACHLTIMGGKIEDAEYNPGLGVITNSSAHRKEVAKRLGVEEIGNDYKAPDEIHKTNDKALSEKRKKVWDSV